MPWNSPSSPPSLQINGLHTRHTPGRTNSTPPPGKPDGGICISKTGGEPPQGHFFTTLTAGWQSGATT